MQPEQNKKFSYLDEFKIIKTLGAGYHAQVKLGMDQDGNLYAIKRYKKETANLATLQHELNIMKVLQHQNLVRLIDVRENATYRRKNQETYKCFAIILQYVGGGELFDFIAQTGKFSQKVSRTYFHQMMNGLYYMHSKGYAHRDIKPENILLGRDFVLKLADFGFSCLLKGKDGSGILHTKLGTEGYMAPEVPGKNYDGAKADIFAAGVILFIMYAGNPPFEKAATNDPYYKLIKQKNYATFWKAHARKRPINFFSQQFKDLFCRMTDFNPSQRPSIVQIANHPWVKAPICTQAEIKQEFQLRLKKLDVVLQQRRRQQQEQKIQHNNSANNMGQMRGGDLQVQSPFMQIYWQQQDKNRKIGKLQPINADDFVIQQGITYAITLLRDFAKNKKILIQDENEIIGEQNQALRAIEVNDTQDGLNIKYQLIYEVQGQQFSQSVEIDVHFGISQSQKLTISINHINGNRLYFKKVAKQFKNLYAYCRA